MEGVEEHENWTLAVVLQRVSGAASGIPVPFRYWGVGRWRAGRLELVENYNNPDSAKQALERYLAAGEPAAPRRSRA